MRLGELVVRRPIAAGGEVVAFEDREGVAPAFRRALLAKLLDRGGEDGALPFAIEELLGRCGRPSVGELCLGVLAYLNAKAAGDPSYYYKIMLPGALVGALSGYFAMRYGRASSPR